jgi:phosphoserine phosphatase
MLLADMDSTMIEQECIDELADEAGFGARVKDITARAMNGELDFDAALRERVGLLAGLPEAVIGKVLAERITMMPGGRALLATMKAQGAYAAPVGLPRSPYKWRRCLALTSTGRIHCWWRTVY